VDERGIEDKKLRKGGGKERGGEEGSGGVRVCDVDRLENHGKRR